ncbi:MAG: hypothetical protein COW02_08075 [Comamonadaceae bacterium CG12_big_fil_rev_8_21_14_0_65_59_15]|nr:MAG: hypothetical protein COW02_08075 [Comamonadaceae bacterium CG12_big_fil_rev_8_21_14_0_65_59_15]
MKTKQVIGAAYTNVNCPICGGEGRHFHSHDGYEIDRCGDCGFIYTKEIPSTDWLKQYYSNQYSANVTDGAYNAKKTWGLKHWLLANFLSFLTPSRGGQTKKLLEIGCSQGVLLRQFKAKKDWHAVGVDYGGAAVNFACQQGLDAHVSDVESMHFEPATFDAVVALHVMEHVQNLDVFITEIHRVLKQGGYFFAVMPSMSHYKPKLAGASWKYWGPPGHLWYFTNHSLTLFLESNGFEVKHCSSLYHRAHVRILARKK